MQHVSDYHPTRLCTSSRVMPNLLSLVIRKLNYHWNMTSPHCVSVVKSSPDLSLGSIRRSKTQIFPRTLVKRYSSLRYQDTPKSNFLNLATNSAPEVSPYVLFNVWCPTGSSSSFHSLSPQHMQVVGKSWYTVEPVDIESVTLRDCTLMVCILTQRFLEITLRFLVGDDEIFMDRRG